jgi:sugar phosphate isomerase/epimerase
MDRIGIEHLGVFGLPPVEFVRLAADLDCRYISILLTPVIPYNPHGYPPFSLREDAALRREMMTAMTDCGVQISLGEGFAIQEDTDIRDAAADLDVMFELGVRRINTLSFEPDLSRTFDQFGVLAELAGSRGMETTVEPCPALTVRDLDMALTAIHHVGRSDFRLLVDTMHIVRSGSGPGDLAAIDPELIGYIQVSDVPLQSKFSSYLEEAMYERMVPGEGELPLREIIAALPSNLVIGLEIPLRSATEAGQGPRDRLGRCVTATRALLASSR